MEKRIEAVRLVQADPELEKAGDSGLFEALAVDDAERVWRPDGAATTEPLIDYVTGLAAALKRDQSKVPAYRHPHPLMHPVFCEFGNSRWTVAYDVHGAGKALLKTLDVLGAASRAAQAPDAGPRQVKKAASAAKSCAKKADAYERARKLRQVSLHVWNGKKISEAVGLTYAAGRLDHDLMLPAPAGDTRVATVVRADRLGRCAANPTCMDLRQLRSLYEMDKWNARLQAPRTELEELARYEGNPALRRKATNLRSNLAWFITFSAQLIPHGTWVSYATAYENLHGEKLLDRSYGEISIKPGGTRDSWRGLAYPFWHPDNKGRQGYAKHGLSRFAPPLRVLSVDLGHRYAAACAVWETLTGEAMTAACRKAGLHGPKPNDLHLHIEDDEPRQSKRNGKPVFNKDGSPKMVQPVAVYRRIGPDMLDGKPHPAPWARLDRQFNIKLQGEDEVQFKKVDPRSGKLVWDAVRRASESERDWAKGFAASLGYRTRPDEDERPDIDELQFRAARIARLALRRHADRARIAFAMHSEFKYLPGDKRGYWQGGHEDDSWDDDVKFDERQRRRVEFVRDALVTWYRLATNARWQDRYAVDTWNEYILKKPLKEVEERAHPTAVKADAKNRNKKLKAREAKDKNWQKLWDEKLSQPIRVPDEAAEREQDAETGPERRAGKEALEALLLPVADKLLKEPELMRLLHRQWGWRWSCEEGKPAKTHDELKPDGSTKTGRTIVDVPATGWHQHLRSLHDILVPRHVARVHRGADGKYHRVTDAQKLRAARLTGGLSLTRIGCFQSLYQLDKAFYTRFTPDGRKPERNKDGKETGQALTASEGFGKKLLKDLEEMRLNRVKQIASRVVEAALGIGSENREKHWDKGKHEHTLRPRTRLDLKPKDEADKRSFAPCHAVVIENLDNYRPDELQTRAENRRLMSWSSSKVRKYLQESCQLHGIHLREVMPNYTSRQDSRTGAPGIRCADVPVPDFLRRYDRLTKNAEGEEKLYLDALKSRWTEDSDEKRPDILGVWTDCVGVKWARNKRGTWVTRDGRVIDRNEPKERKAPPPVRIPQRGGDIFVSAVKGSPGQSGTLTISAPPIRHATRRRREAEVEPRIAALAG